MTRPWEKWTRTWKPWGGGPERTGPSLTKRSIAALRSFSRPEDVTIAKLYSLKGVGRKTVREIEAAFRENGYAHMGSERSNIERHWTPEAVAARRASAAERSRATMAARQAVIDAAVAAWPHIEKHLGGKKIEALGRAIGALRT